MKKNIFIWCVFIVFAGNSCKSQQNNDDTATKAKELERPTLFDLEVYDLTLITLSKDTNEMHIELGMPSGDFTSFDFKAIPKNKMDTIGKVRGLFIELKRSENKNIPIDYLEEPNPFNYHAYSFVISKKDWEDLKIQAKEIVTTADTSLLHNFCSSCPSYSMVYNYSLIEDKLTKDKKIEKLYNALIKKYKVWLYASKK